MKNKLIPLGVLLLTFMLLSSKVYSQNYDIAIPDNYYYFYVLPKDNPNAPKNVIFVGQPAKVHVWVKNVGDYINNRTISVRLKIYEGENLVFNKSESRYVSSFSPQTSLDFVFEWTPSKATPYTIKANASINIKEVDYSNNVQELTITPKLISLTLSLVPDSISKVRIRMVLPNNTIKESEISGSKNYFSLSYGNVSLSLIDTSKNFSSILYKFSNFSSPSLNFTYKNANEISFLLNKDARIELRYNTLYRCELVTKNYEGKRIDGVKVYVNFPNGSIKEIVTPYVDYLQPGSLKVLNATYQNYTFSYPDTSFNIMNYGEYSIPVDIRDEVIKVVDVFNMPVEGAKVSVTFANGTKRSFETDSSGTVVLNQIPLGKVNGTVEYYFFGFKLFNSSISNPTNGVAVVNVYFSSKVIMIVTGLTLAILISVLLYVLQSVIGKALRKEKVEKQAPEPSF